MKPVTIFYGAGGHARECLDRWISEGFEPVCFADEDELKYYKTLGGLVIFPLDVAIARYPDFVLYLTHAYENLRPVTDYLIERGIPRERIKYADQYEWRKGCYRIGRHAGFLFDGVHICCQEGRYENLARTESIELDLENIKEYAANLIDDLRNGHPTPCDGCHCLVEDIWEIEPKLWRVGVCSEFPKTYCNIKCSYCDAVKMFKRAQRSGEETPFECIKKISAAIDTDKVILGYAAGEITVSPQCNDTLDFIREKRWYTQLSTNAVVYNEKITELLREGIIEVIASIDAGTKETFHKIKGVDSFDKVISNVEKYSEAQGRLYLKYIVIDGINDNDADIDGFIAICKKTGVETMLSVNYLGLEEMTEKMFNSCLRFIEKTKENNIKMSFIRGYFPPKDYERLEKALLN